MRIPKSVQAWSRLTYTSDDGAEAEDVWNTRPGPVPAVITLRSGTLAALTAITYEGPGYEVPPGTRHVVEASKAQGRRGLGWPGQPHLHDPEA